MKVFVDVREKTLVRIVKKELNVEPEIVPLPVGDVIIQDEQKQVVCERKTIPDLASSIMSGHLKKQLLQMEQYDHPILIVVGSFRDVPFKRIGGGIVTVNQQLGLLSSMAIKYKTQILFVPNNTQLVKLCFAIFKKINQGNVLSWTDTELLRTKLTTDDYQLKMLCSLPGVSLKTAQKLKEICCLSLRNTAGEEASEDHLTGIEGIGGKKAKKILEVFNVELD